ncbi:MAG: 2-dehydropantoate 2-reductase [Acetobacteraceae bacterium]|nr:2-dehydropantoate 2-reductase [Acetobacteraceae bacterium]
MRIAVIGAGGVGGGFGAALAQAGGDVTFVARGAHLAAMRAEGLRVEGDRGNTLIKPCQATDDPASIGPVDIVLFCVKLWDVERAAETIRSLIGSETAVIPLQNGVDAPERLVGVLGAGAVMGGTVGISATIGAPGLIRQVGSFMTMTFGELDGRPSPRGERFLALCHKASFQATLTDTIETAIWTKFILLTAMSGGTAITRLPIGRLRDDPDVFAMFEGIMRETEAVGRAKGVALPADVVDRLLNAVRGNPPHMMASMAHDLVRGNRLELPWLAGKVVALGKALGVPTPVNATIFAALKPYANGAPG